MINYYRFCCRIRIADEYADEVPGGEFLAVEDGRAEERRQQFADSRVNEFSDWFYESPALRAHIRAICAGDFRDVRERLIDTAAACKAIGRDRQTLYRWLREGRLTAYELPMRAKVWGTTSRAGWDFLELPVPDRDGNVKPPPEFPKKS